MVSVVNGYVCQTGCDEAIARKGHDPRNPKDDPVKAEQLAIRDGTSIATNGADAARDVRNVSFDEEASTVAASAGVTENWRNPESPALFYDRSV